MRTLRPRLLAHVEARHDYFADGRCREMHFEPTPDCRRWLSAFELIVRADGHGLSVHAPEDRIPDLWDEVRAAASPMTLDFGAHSRDPAFAYYTECPEPQPLRIPLGPQDAGAAPDANAWLAELYRHWTLQWHSRSTIWCYWLLGEWEEKILAIVDTRGSREFDALGRRPFGATQAHCFRSRNPLALREHAPGGLQLRAGNSAAATRVVVSQLPAPRPSALQYESGPDGRQAVSEIFVSR